MAYGLTAAGFAPKTFEIIREEINVALRAAFGPSLDLSDGSILGQIVAIMAALFAELWELAEAVNSSTDPDSAVDTALDAICALTGTEREAATESTVTLTLTGTATTVVPESSQVSVTTTDALFETDAEATLVALSAWAATTAYVVGDRRTNASRCYVVTAAGTSAGSGGPTTTSSAITDGSVIWRYIGEGAAAVDVEATALETGPTVATSGSIVTIETPISGWSSVMNLTDADEGRDEETNEDLRVRREVELAAPGTGPVDAIRADLLDVAGVTAVTVFQNTTDLTDADGVPPHAIEALVSIPVGAANDQLIFDQLLASVAAGIATHGDVVGTATDSAGNVHTMKFSRPEEIEVYVDVTLIKDPDTYPADGDDQIKAAIVAYGDAQSAGRNVVASKLVAAASAVAGVLDVTDIDIGDAPAPTLGTTIPVSVRQIAVYDTARVTVSTSDGVP